MKKIKFNKIRKFINNIKLKRYRNKLSKLININFNDDYDILYELLKSEDSVINIINYLDKLNIDKKLEIKLLLNINKILYLENTIRLDNGIKKDN